MYLVLGAGVSIDFENADANKLINILRGNRVPVAIMKATHRLSMQMGSTEFSEFIRSETARFEVSLQECRYVSENWRSEGIDGVLLKSPGYFPYTSDNIDILVPESDIRQAIQILRRLNYIELPYAKEPYKWLFRKTTSPFGYPIHLHSQVAWINTFISDSEILESAHHSTDEPFFLYPSATMALGITTAHWFYEDKTISLRDLYHFSCCVRQGVEWEHLMAISTKRGWRDGLEIGLLTYREVCGNLGIDSFCSSLPALDRTKLPPHWFLYTNRINPDRVFLPDRVSKIYCKAMHFRKSIRDTTLQEKQKLKELCNLVRYAFSARFSRPYKKKTIIVAISGIDGVGKTTLAKKILHTLNEFGIAASYHWTRPGSSLLLSLLKWPIESLSILFGKKTQVADFPSRQKIIKASLIEKRWISSIWGAILVMDFMIRLSVKYLAAYIKGGVHIFDRYTMDAKIDIEETYGFRHLSVLYDNFFGPHIGVLLRSATNEFIKINPTEIYSPEAEFKYYPLIKVRDLHINIREISLKDELHHEIVRQIIDMLVLVE